ncbi:hypothetical protein F4781DRAFT_294051 [Annulohypoxylon bovei var. microspora]|nr:hypothetical protein F4781DRAFT_294051 [Annulohypoxylon bovei var. microspora]
MVNPFKYSICVAHPPLRIVNSMFCFMIQIIMSIFFIVSGDSNKPEDDISSYVLYPVMIAGTLATVFMLKPVAAVGGILSVGAWLLLVYLVYRVDNGWGLAMVAGRRLYGTLYLVFWVGYMFEWSTWLFWTAVRGAPPDLYGKHEFGRILCYEDDDYEPV